MKIMLRALSCINLIILICHLIGMEVGWAVSKSDWLEAGLLMDFLVFVCSHTNTGYRLQAQARSVLQDLDLNILPWVISNSK